MMQPVSRSLSGLRSRLLLLALLAVLPALVLILATGVERRRFAAESSKKEALRLARLAASSQDALVEGARQLLIALAQLPQIRDQEIGQCNLFMKDLIQHFPNYASVSVAGLDGGIVCSSMPLERPVWVGDRAYFRTVLETGDFVVGSYLHGRITQTSVLPFAYPVIDSAGQIQSILIASLNLNWLSQIAPQADLLEDSTILVTDQDGVILTRYPDPGDWMGKKLPDAGIIEAILSAQGEGTAETLGVDNVVRLYAFVPVGNQSTGKAYVSVGIPSKVVYAEANRSLALNLMALGVVAFFALIAAWYTGDMFILRPVNRLVTATHRLAGGDLSARSGIPEGPGEINQLASAFDSMAGELEKRDIQLRHTEARYRSLVEQIPAVTYMLSLHNSNKPLYISPQVEAILGFTPEEWMGDPDLWEKHLHPQDCERVMSELAIARSNGSLYQAEYRFRRRNGWFVWLRDQAFVVKDDRGQPLCLQGLLLDISDLKRADAELQQYAARLERSNQELQDFAYIASHDLQEPLRKIQAFGERLVTRHSQDLSQDGREYVDRMIRDAARMQSMINDLLAYSRVATKAQPFTPVDLGRNAHEAVSDLQVRLDETGGKVEIKDLPWIEGDSLQIRQLFQNLIGNALKFHRPGVQPLVKVYGKIISPLDASSGEIVQIMVVDNGIGFEEKYLDRIFEPFQRLHGRGVYEGSGIGLSICRKIAERHGGAITAHSQPGEGATFAITLPLKQPVKERDEGWETDTEVQSLS